MWFDMTEGYRLQSRLKLKLEIGKLKLQINLIKIDQDIIVDIV